MRPNKITYVDLIMRPNYHGLLLRQAQAVKGLFDLWRRLAAWLPQPSSQERGGA
jgi:hypothetical protein